MLPGVATTSVGAPPTGRKLVPGVDGSASTNAGPAVVRSITATSPRSGWVVSAYTCGTEKSSERPRGHLLIGLAKSASVPLAGSPRHKNATGPALCSACSDTGLEELAHAPSAP